MTLREHWDTQADAWAAFARTPGHDHFHSEFNFPTFLTLLPPPGRGALDVGCGEGRVGAELLRRGYRIVGVDASPRMVELAGEHHEAVVADATALPYADGSFDLVIAFMSLMNMDNLDAAVREIGRVLEPGGRLCAAEIHPFNVGEFLNGEPDSAYVIPGSYVEPPGKVFVSDRDGIRMTFRDQPIPLERYSRAFEGAGLLLETVREPQPPDAYVAAQPTRARRRRIPLVLHLRGVKPPRRDRPRRGTVPSRSNPPSPSTSKAAWEEEARNWAAWARTPEHDAYWIFRDAFFEDILPPPGRATLEVGCGEGRVARDLRARDHRLTGVDASPTLLELARESDPGGDYRVADAAELPFADASFDVVVAYNSLMDFDDLEGSAREIARVLEPGGTLAASITHPLADAGRFEGREPDSPFVIRHSYFERRRLEETFSRDGLSITFHGYIYPLEDYTAALEQAGFLIERLREPPVPEREVERDPAEARWRRLPNFLFIRAVRA